MEKIGDNLREKIVKTIDADNVLPCKDKVDITYVDGVNHICKLLNNKGIPYLKDFGVGKCKIDILVRKGPEICIIKVKDNLFKSRGKPLLQKYRKLLLAELDFLGFAPPIVHTLLVGFNPRGRLLVDGRNYSFKKYRYLTGQNLPERFVPEGEPDKI